MKLLADANIEKGIVDCLLRFGFDVKWIPDYNCEMDDAALLTMANNEKRILITNDKDFGELVFLKKQISVGIILNHFSIITSKKFRFMPLEDII